MDYDDVLATDHFDIDSEYLAQILLESREHFGSTDWDIYIHEDETIDCRHNTYSTNGWIKIIDLYSWQYDETFDLPINEIASWLQEDIIPTLKIDSSKIPIEIKRGKTVRDIECHLDYAIRQLEGERDFIDVKNGLKRVERLLRDIE